MAYLVIAPTIAMFGEQVATPIFPSEHTLIRDMGPDTKDPSGLRNFYILYIGAGAVATGGIINSSGDSVVSATSPANTGDWVVTVQGTIRPTAGGTLQVQAACEVSTTSGVLIRGFSNLTAQAC